MDYLGTSNEEWTFMAEEAESLLIDREIGQHVIGLYPSGDRIFGDMDAVPEVMCMYMDTPHKLLDPFADHDIEGYHVTQNGHKILFCDLFAWVKMLGRMSTATHDTMARKFIHLIPTMLSAQYEDEQLSIITATAGDYLQECGWDNPQLLASKAIKDEADIQVLINDACYLRARYILKTQGVFAPCINTDWDTVETLEDIKDSKIIEVDQQLVEYMSDPNGTIERSELNNYRQELIKAFYPVITTDAKQEKSRLSHLMKSYLLSLL